MSGGNLLTLSILEATAPLCTPEAHQCLFAVFERIHPGFLQFVYDIGYESGLPPRETRHRCLAAIMFYSAAQLADDLSDGDCSHIRNPEKTGPVTLMILLNCGWKQIMKTGLSHKMIIDISETMRSLMMAQLQELTTKTWNYERALAIAHALGGGQMKVCLQLLLASTSHYRHVMRTGPRLGFALHVATDKMHRDPRLYSLVPAKRKLLINEAHQALETLQTLRLQSMQNLADTIIEGLNCPVLKRP